MTQEQQGPKFYDFVSELVRDDGEEMTKYESVVSRLTHY